MATKARLETVLTGDDSPFVAAVNRAEKRAQSFSSRVTSLFRRTPERRAETALSGFAADLASGNVAGAVANLTGRISGFGLAAGIAVGAAVETFIKFRGEAQDADKATAHLAETLGTFSNVDRGPEALAKHFQEISASVTETLEKTDRLGNRIARFAEDYLQPLATKSRRGPAQDAEIRAGLSEEINTLGRRGEAELNLQRIQEEGLTLSEREAQLDKIGAEAAEKRAAIKDEQLKALSDISKLSAQRLLPEGKAPELIQAVNESARSRADAVSRSEKASTEAIERQFNLKAREEEVENRILNLQGSGLSKEEAATAAIRERINLLKQQLTLPSTIEEKSRIGTQIHGLENQLIQGEYQESKRTPQQRAAEFLEQQNFQNFIRRQTPSPGAYLSSPEAYGRRDILGREVDAAGNVIGPGGPITPPSYQTPTFSHELDQLDQHMTPFGGSDEFNKWFHPESAQPTEQPSEEQQPQDLVGAIKDAFDGVMEKYWG